MTMEIAQRYQLIKKNIAEAAIKSQRDPKKIELIVVTKGRAVEEMIEIYQAGARDIGESRLQEASLKRGSLPTDVRWHFIGTLQKNKVKPVISSFALIHSVDHPDLAKKISLCSEQLGIETNILLQVNTSGETSKHGMDSSRWDSCFSEMILLPYVKIQGLMTMAPLTSDETVIRECFRRLRLLRDRWMLAYGSQVNLIHLSMGMSNDYRLAIEEGATLVRIGSALFKSNTEESG